MDYGQQAVWNEIRRLHVFTVTEVWGAVDMHRGSIINYIKRPEAGGYVRKCPDFEKTWRYQLTRNAGHHAPRLTRDGEPVTQGGANENMWRSMRMMGVFTPQDLAVHSTTETTNVAVATAKAYCTMLMKAGYLRVVRKAQPPTRQAAYRLVRDTGPLHPQIQRVKQVYDQNLGEVTYHPELRT